MAFTHHSHFSAVPPSTIANYTDQCMLLYFMCNWTLNIPEQGWVWMHCIWDAELACYTARPDDCKSVMFFRHRNATHQKRLVTCTSHHCHHYLNSADKGLFGQHSHPTHNLILSLAKLIFRALNPQCRFQSSARSGIKTLSGCYTLLQRALGVCLSNCSLSILWWYFSWETLKAGRQY